MVTPTPAYQEYVSSTHAETHNLFTLEIEDIFKVKRDGEAAKYKVGSS